MHSPRPTQPVSGLLGECLPARCPLPPGYFGPGSQRERSRGGHPPSRFRILGGAELGREEKGPRGEGTPKILREEPRIGARLYRGPGREEGGLEFPPTAHGSGVNSLRSLAEGAGWHLPLVWHSQLPPPPFLGQPLMLSLPALPATLLWLPALHLPLALTFDLYPLQLQA